MAATEDEIVAFVREFCGARRDPPDRSDLLRAYRIDGDDAAELVEAFGRRFGVDLAGYRWYFHHGGEGWSLFRPQNRRVRRIPLSAAMLAGFAELGRWDIAYPAHRADTGADLRRDRIAAACIALLALAGLATWLIG